ncbi:hypothetical protein BT96DRAFT_967302 [Gymnopus androsaceus JB14]|uniref:F-box domain-containing protein n=1 Tax=Gymnopus androsaceus JB14 TaxID=1447944 RepID=A0A6A4H471_9AGAR|nr:hypothetical protein BT96DRAFT_967302 [Gymnopus androsaceus JB14]
MITLAYPAFSRAQEGDGRHSKSDSSGSAYLCPQKPSSSIQTPLEMIPHLPEDIFIAIFQYLSLRDVLSMRRVCKSFKDLTHLRGLWILLLRTEIWDRNIPTPHLDLEHLTAAQIEEFIAHSLLLHRNWTSASPVVRLRRHVNVATPRARITSLHFITMEGRSCLLSFSLTSRVEPRTLTVECWDLSSLRCKARRTVQWFGGYAVNSDPSSTGLMAIRTPHVEVLAFDPAAPSPDSAFITLITLSVAAKSVLTLAGTTMIFRAMNNALIILDISRPLYAARIEDRQPLLPPNQPDSFEAIIQDEYAIIMRPKTLALLFPWPVNLLHHYVLRPNDSYLPPIRDNIAITSSNLPYHFPPVLSQTIASPVRLFAITDMALGPYGTAVWIDSHTEDFYHQGDVGQRLAGLMLNPVVDERQDAHIDGQAADQNTQTAGATIVFGVHETDDWNRVAIDEEGGRIAVGSVNGEIMIDDYVQR